MGIIVALDAGTTGVRALAVDQDGTVRGISYREFTQHFPRPGWVEHDLDEIWAGIQTVIAELAEMVPEPIVAIGITNQRETVAAWSRSTGEPRHRAIVWQDRRTAAVCDRLTEDGHLPLVRSTTGLVLDPYFSGTKFAWLLTEGGVTADDDLALGTIDSWLIWKLTGGEAHVTEPSNASRTLLFDIRELTWSAELGDVLGVPLGALPEVRPSSGRFGVTTDSTALGAGIPISGVAGDQQAALFGQACFEPGMTKNTYGTGSFVLMNVGSTVPRTGRRLADHGGLDPRAGPACDLRLRRRHLRDRSGHPVATGRARHHRGRGGDRASGGQCRELRRRVFRAWIRSGWAALGGTPTPGERSSASPGEPGGPSWPGPPWSRWCTRPAMWSMP